MTARRDLICPCGHDQALHAGGFGACPCGCEAFRLRRGEAVTVLYLVDAGDPPRVAPTFLVQCPDCGDVYETRAYRRELATRRRCRTCSDERRTQRAKGASAPRPVDLPPAERYEHGQRARYVAGCRCELCTLANREYARLRQKLARMGQGDPLVSAARARRHLQRLSAAGIGRDTVADVAGVGVTGLGEVLRGRKTNIRRSTESKILSVTRDATHDAKLVPAGPTVKRLEELLFHGYTRTVLAARLGSRSKTPALQVGARAFVTAKTAQRVERLHRQLMGKEPS